MITYVLYVYKYDENAIIFKVNYANLGCVFSLAVS